MRLKYLSQVALAALLASSAISMRAKADSVVNSDFVFQLNDSIFTSPEFSFASALSGSQSFTMPDTVIQDIGPVNVSGISVQTNYTIAPSVPQIYLGADIALASTALSATITIQSISIDTDIVTQAGNTTVVTHVQGQCTNIPIHLVPSKAQLVGSILATLDSSGLPIVTIPWFQAQWTPDAWTFGTFSCTGIDGFHDKVTAGLTNYLANPKSFNAQLLSTLQAQAATYQAKARAWFSQPKTFSVGIGGLTVTMVPQKIQNLNGENFQLKGTLSFAFANTAVNNTASVAATSAASQNATGFALLLPDGLTAALNSAAYATGAYQYEALGQSISGFKNLLASSVDEWLVWPELANYPATADFRFDISAPSIPRLSSFTDNGDGTLSQNATGSVYVVTMAPSGSTHVPMAMFSSPVATTYQLSLSPTATGSVLNLGFTNLALNVTGMWDGTYAAVHNPNTIIGISTLQSNVISGLQSSGMSVAIGKLALTSSMSLSATSLQNPKGWLQINWK